MSDATEPTTAADVPGRDEKQVPDLTGTRMGDYQILRRLGQGGMGQVYVAEQISLKRKVALKLLKSDLAANDSALQRFKREAEAVARATHANIVQVYAIHEHNGQHFMALEYVEGRNLRDYLEKKGPPETLIAIGILRQVASALQRASELGVVHRDIKPENILITRKGEVKVADFGLSRIYADEQQPLNLTQSGITMGTPLYMSPEQVEGKPLDPRTDIYSLGVTAYHLLSGEPPFRGQTPFEVAVQHVQKEPTPLCDVRPDLPAELCFIVHKMMAKKPESRYQTAQDIVRDLQRLRDQLVGLSQSQLTSSMTAAAAPAFPALTGSEPSATVLLTGARPRRFPWLPLLGVFLMLGAGVALGLWWKQSGGLADTLPAKADPLDVEKKEEERWLQQFHAFEGIGHKTELEQRLYAAVKLSWLYLERDKRSTSQEYKELDQYFQQLRQMEPPPPPFVGKIGPYRYLGELGEAMVLALRDEPAKSNELFVELLKKPTPARPPVPPKVKSADEQFLREVERAALFKEYFRDNRHFRKLLSLALQRNHDNAPEDFPELLNTFRYLPPWFSEPKKTGS